MQILEPKTLSPIIEDYLKHIYLLARETDTGRVRTKQLAQRLGASPSSVNRMAKRLAERKLARYAPHQGIELNFRGRRLAVLVLKRHRLIESFLVQTLGLPWEHIHEEADRLEHAISKRVLNALDKHLKHPEFDPHGDPIPQGHLDPTQPEHWRPLSHCAAPARLRICRLLKQDEAFLKFARQQELIPGLELELTHNDAAADNLKLKLASSRKLHLGYRIAQSILVEPIS